MNLDAFKEKYLTTPNEIDFGHFEEYCQKLIPAYFSGISKYLDISNVSYRLICEIILIKFGYRFVQGFMYAEDDEGREEAIYALQKILEMGEQVETNILI